MVEPATNISVHCQLPKNIVPNNLDLDPTNWEWKELLVFPVSKLDGLPFSKPYKWIRYATGIVLGAHGELHTERDFSDSVPVNYSSDLSRVSINLYYHTTDQEKGHMFPIDHTLANKREVTSSRTSTRRADFRDDVEERDGKCVVTGDPPLYCDAVHLLPHCKGDTYIEKFTTGRYRDPSDNDSIVRDIDSVLNGLFLNKVLHVALGLDVALLRTPNFAMDTTDVDPNADAKQERFTYHIFNASMMTWLYPKLSGSAIRVPSDMSMWPPAVLFDAVYARTVWHHFGVTDELKEWGNVLYPDGPTNAVRADEKRRRDHTRQQRSGNRGTRKNTMDSFDMVMLCPFMAMGPEKTKAYFKECEEMAATREHKELEEKVNSWREEVD